MRDDARRACATTRNAKGGLRDDERARRRSAECDPRSLLLIAQMVLLQQPHRQRERAMGAGLHALKGGLGLGSVDVGVGIEARAEAELPERLLCCARLNRAVGAPERSEGWFSGLLG